MRRQNKRKDAGDEKYGKSHLSVRKSGEKKEVGGNREA